MELLKMDSFEDLFLDIKYEGISFDGVMNIYDLGHELVGLEYCLKTIILRLLKEDKKTIKNKILRDEISDLNINDFEILTEGFVNNCFLKRIKFKKTNKIISLLDEIENRPELNKYVLALILGSFSLYGTIYVAQLTANKDVLLKSLDKGTISTEVLNNIQESNLSQKSKTIALELIGDKKFRNESGKTISPIKDEGDYLELSSKAFSNLGKESIIIKHSNKDIFLSNSIESEKEDDKEYVKYDLIEGRISSINLDANKNQIGFKVLNEGTEINCHLIDSLKITDYKEGFLGEWVEIEGNITYTDDVTKYIEIHNIKKIQGPIREAEQITMLK